MCCSYSSPSSPPLTPPLPFASHPASWKMMFLRAHQSTVAKWERSHPLQDLVWICSLTATLGPEYTKGIIRAHSMAPGSALYLPSAPAHAFLAGWFFITRVGGLSGASPLCRCPAAWAGLLCKHLLVWNPGLCDLQGMGLWGHKLCKMWLPCDHPGSGGLGWLTQWKDLGNRGSNERGIWEEENISG